MSELLLDPRLEILDIIDKESHNYKHSEQYVRWDEGGQISACCINGLVMLHFGWKPDRREMTSTGTPLPESWQRMATFMNKRYGPNTLGDINAVNSGLRTWEECRKGLVEYWDLPAETVG